MVEISNIMNIYKPHLHGRSLHKLIAYTYLRRESVDHMALMINNFDDTLNLTDNNSTQSINHSNENMLI